MNDPAGASPDAPSPHFSWLSESAAAPTESTFDEIALPDVRVTEAPPSAAPAAIFDTAGIASGGPQPDPPAFAATGNVPAAAQTRFDPPAPIHTSAGAGPVPAYPGPVYPPPAAPYPISSPPTMGYPVSGPPISGVPFGYPAYPPPAPPKSRRAALIILTILTALLTTATGVMTTLYLLKVNEANKLSQNVSSHQSTIATQRTDLEKLNRDMDDVKRQLTNAQDESTQLTTAKNSVAKCLTTIYDFWDLLDANKTSEANKKADEVEKVCAEADKYL